MYTRIALGKNSAMDVVSGESSGGQGQLLILYPLLFALQGLEMYIGKPHLLSCLCNLHNIACLRTSQVTLQQWSTTASKMLALMQVPK